MQISKEEAEKLYRGALTADGLAWRIENALTRVRNCLEGLADTVSRFEKNLPTQQGFFTNKCDTYAYYPMLCDVLRLVERQSGELREALVELTSAELFFREQRGAALHAETVLTDAGEHAYAERLSQDRDQVRTLLEQERSTADRLQAFCKGALADFYRRALELSDAENNGKSLHVSALKRLCGDFVFSVRALARVMEIKK